MVRAVIDLGTGARFATEDQGHRVMARPLPRGFSGPSFRAAWLPARLGQPLRVEVAADQWLDIEGAFAREPRLEGGAVVVRDAAPDTDAVYAAVADGVEELRVLRSAASPSVFSWTLRLGPGLREARLRDGRVEILDASGTTRIASAPMMAIDARGTKRAPVVELAGLTLRVSLDTSGLTYPIVLDPKWTPSAGALTYAKYWSPLVRVASGKVYAVGSYVVGTGSDSVEVFDPATAKWSLAGKLGSTRSYHTATLLTSGKVLVVAGGNGGSGAVSTAEVYDPATGTSAPTGSLSAVRMEHVAALLPDGRVLVAGGGSSNSGPALASAEIWDPAFGTWSAAPSMSSARTWTTASVLPSGKVVVASGGIYGSTFVLPSSETYDPATNTWSTAAMAGRRRHVAVVIGTKLFVAGGEDPSQNATTALFDGTSWTAKASMSKVRGDFVGAPLPDGRVLVATKSAGGGYGDATAEIWDPVANTWSAAPSLSVARYATSAIPLIGGRVLVVGGYGAATSSEIFFPDPKVCATGGDCPSGTPCVDSYCCNTACTGQCEACDVVGQEGVCTPVVGAPHAKTSCGTYLCDPSVGTSGACATSCLTSSACSTGNYCAVGSCVAKKADSSTCVLAEECISGNCVDGVCCSTGCTGSCVACDVAGSVGTCTNVASGPPHASHTCGGFACSAGACLSSCTTDTSCDAKSWCSGGACIAKRANGTGCAAGRECSTGNCVDGYCCDSACTSPCSACDVATKLGTCSAVTSGSPHGTRSCAPALSCGATGCVLTCSSDAQCAVGSACIGGICKGKKANGVACAASTECTTGNCVDGVCCDSACSGACKACNLATSLGTCTAVDGAPDPHKVCAATACADVCKSGACAFKPSTTLCGTPSCAGSVITSPHCSGTDETCVAGTSSPCAGGLACADDKNCKVACTSGADCATGACNAVTGLCVPAVDAGPADTGADGGVDASDGGGDSGATDSGTDSGLADSGPADSGTLDGATDAGGDTREIASTPAPKLGDHPTVGGEFTRCTKAADCTTGFCVEGVCCDKPCTERCHSCALLASPGKCTPEPVGVDLKQECGPANQCVGTCGNTGECVGSGTGTQCARNRCVDISRGVGPAYCAAPGGACGLSDVVSFECAPYICEPAFGACRTNCVTSADCARDFVCDLPTKSCVPAAAPAAADGGSGGCSIDGRTGSTRDLGLAMLAIGLLGRRRRRTRRC